MTIYLYGFGSGDTAPFVLKYDTDTNLYTVQWYDSEAAAYKDLLQLDGNTKEIKVLPTSNVDVKIDKHAPKITLKGEETDAREISIREDVGDLIARDEDKGIDANLIAGLYYALYGDGSDGSITESADVSRLGMLFATDYDDGGYTVTVNFGGLAIIAKSSIKISGIINASGKGGPGANGGTGYAGGSNGERGDEAYSREFIGGTGTGGSGAADNTTTGGDGGISAGGGGGGTASYGGGWGEDGAGADFPSLAHYFPNRVYDNVMILKGFCSTGGSGGGGGASEASGDDGGDGGAGGRGGGLVVLCAPEISISGTIDASGIAGNPGSDGSGTNAAGGGGGAGGSGGIILIVTPKLIENSPIYNVTKGAGGAGGSPIGTASAGGAGGAGADGKVIKLTTR